MKVFIVEDSDIVRERLAAMLGETKGLEVIGTAAGAREAVGALRRLRPDAVILDLQLAEGSGFDVLKSIRQDRPGLLVLVFTNHASLQHREKCMVEGADYFFDKAIEFDKVQEVCQQWLEQQQTEEG